MDTLDDVDADDDVDAELDVDALKKKCFIRYDTNHAVHLYIVALCFPVRIL